jgi:hypothetical protein
VAVVRGGGLAATSYEYGLALIVPAVVATVNLIRFRTRCHPSTEEVSPWPIPVHT